MSERVIPAQTILVCDRCGREGVQYREGAFAHGGLHIRGAESWGAAWNGDIGGAHVNYDLCAECQVAFERWLKEGKK